MHEFSQHSPRPDDALSHVESGVFDDMTVADMPCDHRAALEGLILVQVTNFPVLRRRIGRRRADTIVNDVAERADRLLPEARIAVCGRDTVEIALEVGGRDSLNALLARLESGFAMPFDVDGERLTIDLVLGASTAGALNFDEVRLVEEAERALNDARIERMPIIRDVEAVTPPVDRIALARDLGPAIANGEMFLQYQPKVHLRQQQVTSLEALIRWEHSERGLILPSDFIPIAEESRDIVAMTLWTIRQAIADQRVLAARGHELTIFINIAGVLLGDARFVRQACKMVQSSGATLGFEITETSVIRDPQSAIANLKVFADIGIVIAIDDYGAGLSSLAYLKQLPARELKIDKLFVTQLTSSNRDPLIVRSTIDLAHALEMEVVAEGVETQAAMALLSVMGCDMVQGFLISRPIGLPALIQFLDDDAHLAASQTMQAPFGRLAAVWKRG